MTQPHHHASQSGLEEMGDNMVHLASAGARAALALASVGLAVPRLVLRMTGLTEEPQSACSCGVRHHYRCCYEPPVYRCRGWE